MICLTSIFYLFLFMTTMTSCSQVVTIITQNPSLELCHKIDDFMCLQWHESNTVCEVGLNNKDSARINKIV
jgi:hypothetical protein